MRDLLNDLIVAKNISLIDKEVLRLSMELDELINIFVREKEIEEKP